MSERTVREVVISGGRVVAPAPRSSGGDDDPVEAPGPAPPADGRVRFVAMNVFNRARFVVRARSVEQARAVLAPHDPCAVLVLVEDPEGRLPAGDAPELVAGDGPGGGDP